jgi:hypothetical protein
MLHQDFIYITLGALFDTMGDLMMRQFSPEE